MIRIIYTPGDSDHCPTANNVKAPEGVCLTCKGLEKCRAAKKRTFDMRSAQADAQKNSLGSLAWDRSGVES